MRMQVISYRTTFINPNEALAAHKGHWFSRVVSAGNDLGEDVPATTLRSCAVEYIRRKPISIPSIVRSNRSPCYCQSVCFRYRSGLLGWAKQDNTLKGFLGLLHAPLFGSEPRLIGGTHDEGLRLAKKLQAANPGATLKFCYEAGPMQARQGIGVAAIGFDPLTGRTWNLGGRHEDAVVGVGAQTTAEGIAVGAGELMALLRIMGTAGPGGSFK